MFRVNQSLKDTLKTLEDPASADTEPGRLIARVVVPLVTALATAITTSVAEIMNKAITEFSNRDAVTSSKGDSTTMANLRRLTFDNDRLEQYTRRENVRIFGVEQERGETPETVERKAVQLMRETGADITSADIEACHRVGRPKNGSRPIIVRFANRKKRTELMKMKRNLKGKDSCKGKFISDDLTRQRLRLFHYVKDLDCVEKVWTIDGKIFCLKRQVTGLPNNEQPKPFVLENPDDLFDLGLNSVDWNNLLWVIQMDLINGALGSFLMTHN